MAPTKIELKSKTPKKANIVPENAFQKLHWMDESADFAICNINNCGEIVTYTKSAKTGLYNHVDQHFNEKPTGRKRKRKIDQPLDELTIKQRISLVIALKLIGQNKLSAFKATSDEMISAYQSILAAAGVNLEKEDIAESRRSVMRTVNAFADKIRDKIKHELENQKVCFVHDDSRSQTGLGEQLRAVTATFVSNGKFQRRFLHIEYNEEKDSQSLANSIREVAEKFGVSDFQIAADGASVNLAAARQLEVVQHTCWSHTVHIISKEGIKSMDQYEGFKIFYRAFEKFISKSSRKHLNAKFSNEDGFTKIPTLSSTRWLSRRNCINSVIKNWDIIQSNKNLVGLTETEWKSFNNLPLFLDLQFLVETATSCLLKFEVQKRTSSQTVIPTISKWIYKMYEFTLDPKRTNLGRILAKEIVQKIDLYCFGSLGSNVKPRIHSTHIIQAVLNPDSHLLNKIKSKIGTKVNPVGGAEAISATNELIDRRYERINDRVWPELKDAYDKYFIANNNVVSSESSSESELDWSNLSQEQVNHLQKKKDERVYYQLKNEFKKFKSFVKDYRKWDENITGESQFSTLIRCFNTMKINNDDHHLLFWTLKDVKLAFPILHKIVYDTIYVPTSNVAVESLYSHVTDIKNFKRSKLTAKNLNDILTLFYSDLYMKDSLTDFFTSDVNK